MVKRVLVVDDNPNNLQLMGYLLKAFGYMPTLCNSAAEGLNALRAATFDFALVDILMPQIDGFEFVRRVRDDAHTRTIPLVAVTAQAMVGDRERILGAGFDGYIAKPIDPERFIDQVKEAIAHADGAARARGNAGPLVLVADDIEVNRHVIRGTLSPFGYRIAEASHAHEAIDLIAREKPALILCDVHMPHGDGFVLVENVKNDPALRDIPFIFISSTAWQTKDKRRALELGASKFILRPIDPQRLLDEVRSAIGSADGDDPDR